MQNTTRDTKWNRLGASTGYLAAALGFVAASFERGAPAADAPAEQFLSYFTRYRAELLAQSLFFVLSAGALLWFIGSLRAFLRRREQGDGRISGIAFGSGILWIGMQLVLQAAQVALALSTADELSPAVARMMGNLTYALSVVAYVPLGVMLAAVAVGTLRSRAFPAWLGWVSAAAALFNIVMSAGLAAQNGPLVPGGLLTYALYGVNAVWQIAAPTLMIVRAAR